MKCIISCEHASNRVPPRFAHLFLGKEKILDSHQAYDEGAANLARRLARSCNSCACLGSVSRLLIDLNRSPSNRKSLFTSYSRNLGQYDREILLKRYYQPYRKKVEEAIAAIKTEGEPVLHISIHSFAPVKNSKVRKADIGLLYDPARKIEQDMSKFLVRLIQEKAASLRVRRNYPYLGKTDGFTSYLRRKYAAKFYAGIEIEINQALLAAGGDQKKKTEDVLTEGIRMITALQDFSKFSYKMHLRGKKP